VVDFVESSAGGYLACAVPRLMRWIVGVGTVLTLSQSRLNLNPHLNSSHYLVLLKKRWSILRPLWGCPRPRVAAARRQHVIARSQHPERHANATNNKVAL
jgi:hypothetical protein